MGTGIIVRLFSVLNRILSYFKVELIPPGSKGIFINVSLEKEGALKGRLANLIETNLSDDFFFLQIGANDGISFDPIYHLVTKYKLRGICLEPIDEYFQLLSDNYSAFPQVKLIKKAVTEKTGTSTMHKVENPRDENLPIWTKGIASLDKDHHRKSGISPSYIVLEEVDTISFDTLIEEEEIEKLDLLVIDAEGYDLNIIESIDFEKIKPKIIFFEHQIWEGLKGIELTRVINMLHGMGYLVYIGRNEILACNPFRA